MNPPQVYMCSPSRTLLPPPSPYHPSGSPQCTSPKDPVSCIEPGLGTRFVYDITYVSMPFSQIIPPSPSPIESKRLFYTFLIDLFVLLLLSFKDYFFILHKSPKLDVSSAPILPQSVACLLIFLILSFAEVFNFNEIQLNYLCHKACL